MIMQVFSIILTVKNKSDKKTKTKKVAKKAKNTKKKSTDYGEQDFGIVIVDDDLTVDRESEKEERKAFLEEARSQEASSDQ